MTDFFNLIKFESTSTYNYEAICIIIRDTLEFFMERTTSNFTMHM